MARQHGYGAGVADGLAAIVLPYPLVCAEHPNGWGSSDVQYMGHLYYCGTVLAALGVAATLAVLTSKPRRTLLADHVWTLFACAALLLALGTPAGLWPVLVRLPLVGTLNNHPFRLLPFVVLFIVLSGGLLLERLLARTARRRTWEIAVGGLVAALLFYHVGMARPAFYAYGFRPYPPLPAEAADLLGGAGRLPQRLVSWSAFRTPSPSYVFALPHDLPMIYGLPAFTGYDPVVESKPAYMSACERLAREPAAASRAYGIRWALAHETRNSPLFSANPCMREMEAAVPWDAAFRQIPFTREHRLPDLPDVTLLEQPDADPLAFAAGDAAHALPLRLRGEGIDVDVRGASAEAIVVNFLWYPELQARADGHAVSCGPDRWQRTVAEVPVGTRTLEIRYCPDWRAGFLKALCLAAAGAVFLVPLSRLRERG